MNQFKPHSKSANHFVIVEPSASLVAKAQELIRFNVNNAKVQANGMIIVHNSYRRDFEFLAVRDNRNATIAPEFDDWEEMDNWLYDMLNSNELARELSQLTPERFNRLYAGKTVGEINEYGK